VTSPIGPIAVALAVREALDAIGNADVIGVSDLLVRALEEGAQPGEAESG
jgi:hypothetical protein